MINSHPQIATTFLDINGRSIKRALMPSQATNLSMEKRQNSVATERQVGYLNFYPRILN